MNIAGGLKISEPSLDLATVMAIVSSFRDKAVDEKTVIFGEVGLSGEVRAVSQAEQRVAEAAKLGFDKILLPASNLSDRVKAVKGVEIFPVSNIKDALDMPLVH